MNNDIDSAGLTPARIDKNGPLYYKSDVDKFVMKAILVDDYFFRQIKENSMNDAEKATAKVNQVTKEFEIAIDRFHNTQKQIVLSSKGAASSLKDASEKIAQGIARIEKCANFSILEKQVELLERAAEAMQKLSDLQSNGRLDKIIQAIK